MIVANTKLLFKLYYNPLAAMGEIIDHGSWLFSAAIVTAVAILLAYTVTNPIYYNYEAVPIARPLLRLPRAQPVALQIQTQSQTIPDDEEEDYDYRATHRLPLPIVGNSIWSFITFNPLSQYLIALSLGVLYVPALILILVLIQRTSSFSVAFRREYGSLLSCTLMAWGASHLPFALIGSLTNSLPQAPSIALALWLLGNFYFGVLIIYALQTVSGATIQHSLITIGLAWLSFSFDSWIISIATISPFFTVIWLIPLALGALAGMRAAHFQRQSFLRHLHAATINDHDAEAQFQLGLIYQQRRQYDEALSRFKRAVEIDPKEPDANFELGVIARKEQRLQDALNHFSIVVAHNDKFRQSEVWREIGATYLAAGMFEEAKTALDKYCERRPFDPEGLYYCGEVHRNLQQPQEAKDLFVQCIEAARTMPYYRRTEASKWSKLAQARLLNN